TGLLLDAIYPSSGSSLPAVVLVHGGGWVSGSRSEFVPTAFKLAQAGWAAFTIDYDMDPPRYPREVNDVAKAVAWVRANAATYRIDPARIAELGASSGATIAVQAGAMSASAPGAGPPVAAIVSWSGP